MSTPQLELFAIPTPSGANARRQLKGRRDYEPVGDEREIMWPPDVMHLSMEQRMLLFGDIPKETRLTVKQVCRRLRCDSNTVHRHIHSGNLVAANIGTKSAPCYRIYRWSLIKHLYDELEGDWSE